MSYLEPVEKFKLTPCCKSDPKSIFYNQYNQVIQCHNCGHIYEPKPTSEVYAKSITKERLEGLRQRLESWQKEIQTWPERRRRMAFYQKPEK